MLRFNWSLRRELPAASLSAASLGKPLAAYGGTIVSHVPRQLWHPWDPASRSRLEARIASKLTLAGVPACL